MRVIVVAALWLSLLTGCAVPGSAELEAYLARSETTARATDAVLDLVAPYERIVVLNDGLDCAAPPAAVSAGIGSEGVAGAAPAAPAEPVLRDPPLRFAHCRRDGFATFGDPPVVGAVRALSGALSRMNRIMAARAAGVSHQLLRRDYGAMAGYAGALATLVPAAGGASVALAKAATDAPPIREIIQIGDDHALRAFVLDNRAAIVDAYGALSASSDKLWGNVRTGARLIGNEAQAAKYAPEQERTTLVRSATARAERIAVLIADWTVLVDRQHELFERYVEAIEQPGGLEAQIASLARAETDVDAWAQGLIERARQLGVRPPRIGDAP